MPGRKPYLGLSMIANPCVKQFFNLMSTAEKSGSHPRQWHFDQLLSTGGVKTVFPSRLEKCDIQKCDCVVCACASSPIDYQSAGSTYRYRYVLVRTYKANSTSDWLPHFLTRLILPFFLPPRSFAFLLMTNIQMPPPQHTKQHRSRTNTQRCGGHYCGFLFSLTCVAVSIVELTGRSLR